MWGFFIVTILNLFRIINKTNNMDEFLFSDDDIRKVLNDNHKPFDDLHDKAVKEIGDRVKVLDCSSMSHENGNIFEPQDYENYDPEDYYVVCEIRLKNRFKATFTIYKQDIIIANPKTKVMYRIASKHVSLL